MRNEKEEKGEEEETEGKRNDTGKWKRKKWKIKR